MAVTLRSIPKAIYTSGDTRKNTYEIPMLGMDVKREDIITSQTQSVAAIILKKDLEYKYKRDWSCRSQGYYCISPETLKLKETKTYFQFQDSQEIIIAPRKYPVKFADEPTAAQATAFLIHKRYVLTAAHCVCKKDSEGVVTNEIDDELVKNIRIVFGYEMLNGKQCRKSFKESDVFEIKKVVAHLHDRDENNFNDWALLELKEEVKGKIPLELDFSDDVSRLEEVYMIGYPQGLPLKYTGKGIVQETQKKNRIKVEITSFPGNSGSPIFNKAYKVIALLNIGLSVKKLEQDHSTGEQSIIDDDPLSEGQILNPKNPNDMFETAQNISSLAFVKVFLEAERGDKESLLKLAKYYRYGVFVPRDVEKSVELLNKVAASKFWKWWMPSRFTKYEALALNELDDIYSPIGSRVSKGFGHCKRIDLEDGHHFDTSSSKQSDIKKTIAFWSYSASLGNGDACFYLAELIEYDDDCRAGGEEPLIQDKESQEVIRFGWTENENPRMRHLFRGAGILGSALCDFELHREFEYGSRYSAKCEIDTKRYEQRALEKGFTFTDYHDSSPCKGCELLYNIKKQKPTT